MRTATMILAILAVSWTAFAHDVTSNARPAKIHRSSPVNDPIDGQAGDTIADAVTITIPTVGLAGTTARYHNDYDEICPFAESTAPDVVYTFTPDVTMEVDVDMLGSAYDTKIYIYDEDLELVACNDDFYDDYVSKLEGVPVAAGERYFLVIDGYGNDQYGMSFGDYLLTLDKAAPPCVIDIPPGAQIEGEPTLVDGYVDDYNGGCNSEPEIYQEMTVRDGYFHGKLGYYVGPDGGSYRDIDWFTIEMPPHGPVTIRIEAEEKTNLYWLCCGCDCLAICPYAFAEPCASAELQLDHYPGYTFTFLCAPAHFWEGETYEYDYVLYIETWGITTTEQHTWSAVKSLFDLQEQ